MILGAAWKQLCHFCCAFFPFGEWGCM
uniref:Uncharacterized protein n=1 Tax=Arundo donax TaxID=35708 RepID=A0A0A9AYF7_ARUDO